MSEETQFADDAVVDAIARVVEIAGGDYVYPPSKMGGPVACKYRDEYGGCVVGRTLIFLSPDIDLIEGRAIEEQTELLWDAVVTNRALSALQAAQDVQDTGHTWEEALAAFNDQLETYEEDENE